MRDKNIPIYTGQDESSDDNNEPYKPSRRVSSNGKKSHSKNYIDPTLLSQVKAYGFSDCFNNNDEELNKQSLEDKNEELKNQSLDDSDEDEIFYTDDSNEDVEDDEDPEFIDPSKHILASEQDIVQVFTPISNKTKKTLSDKTNEKPKLYGFYNINGCTCYLNALMIVLYHI